MLLEVCIGIFKSMLKSGMLFNFIRTLLARNVQVTIVGKKEKDYFFGAPAAAKCSASKIYGGTNSCTAERGTEA